MNLHDEFIDIPLDCKHIHLYPVRAGIVRALRESLPEMRGTVLDVGCGHSPYRELLLSAPRATRYVGLDLADHRSYENSPDLVWDGKTIPLADRSVETIVATEVLEHVPDPQAHLAELYRVLEPNGKVFASVPFFWMLHEVPHDEFRYTPFSLERLFRGAGFEHVDVRALNGWNASLVQMYANWVTFGDENRYLRKLSLRALFPLLKLLLRRDRTPESFATGQMTTGFFCVASKPADLG